MIPRELLATESVETTLAVVNQRLTTALERNGYFESSYHSVPDGFALATQLEQIEPDGTPVQEPERWTLVNPTRIFSLSDYIKALFLGSPGYYRVIVFVVTPHPFQQSDARVTPEQARDWLQVGFNRLPDQIANLTFSSDFACTALIYEFRRPTENDEPMIAYTRVIPGRLHLKRSGIWEALQP